MSFAFRAELVALYVVFIGNEGSPLWVMLVVALVDASKESMNFRRESAFGSTRPELTQASTVGLSGDFDLDRLRRLLPLLVDEEDVGLRCCSLPLPLFEGLVFPTPPGLQLCADEGVITTIPLGEQRIVAPGNRDAR